MKLLHAFTLVCLMGALGCVLHLQSQVKDLEAKVERMNRDLVGTEQQVGYLLRPTHGSGS